MFLWGKCRGCDAQDKRIAYLEKLVDNLLAKLDVANVVTDEPEDDQYSEPEELNEGEEIIG